MPTGSLLGNLEVYDERNLQEQFVTVNANGLAQATLLMEGITCAACVRSVESRLIAIPGLESISVNGSTNRAEIVWHRDQLKLSTILQAIVDLGYGAYPFNGNLRQLKLAGEHRALLRQLALASLLGMQIMMLAFALYSGDWFGMSQDIEQLLRRASFVLTIPIVGYCTLPFFRGAKRALVNRQLGMDVPVSLAIVLAFFASAWSIISASGDVYFESIAMFVALLLASRYFELRARIKATRQFDDLARVIPDVALRIAPGGTLEPVSVSNLRVGDIILVKAGGVIPVDGVIDAGVSSVNEAVISGESAALAKRRGANVLGGSVNIDSPIQIRVSRLAARSQMSEIARLAESAHAIKPRLTILANRISSWFILGVLTITVSVAVYCWINDPSRIISTCIAVLVVSCPCALALATPTAMAAASGAMMSHGIALINASVVETLARSSRFIFDKTGTLTTGELVLSNVEIHDAGLADQASVIAAALAAHSEHSIGRALQRDGHTRIDAANKVHNVPGQGISGIVDGHRYWLGSARFLLEQAGIGVAPRPAGDTSATDKTAYLANAQSLVATFQFSDELKSGTRELLEELRRQGIETTIISGDKHSNVQALGSELNFTDTYGDMRPAAKLALLDRYQKNEQICVVIGDGVNDAPMLAQGYVSVAVGNACDLTKHNADLILLGNDLRALGSAHRISRKAMRIIRQNIVWAITYNASALPLAILGFIPPWLAAIGMSLSSLFVVTNAARINR